MDGLYLAHQYLKKRTIQEVIIRNQMLSDCLQQQCPKQVARQLASWRQRYFQPIKSFLNESSFHAWICVLLYIEKGHPFICKTMSVIFQLNNQLKYANLDRLSILSQVLHARTVLAGHKNLACSSEAFHCLNEVQGHLREVCLITVSADAKYRSPLSDPLLENA